MSLKDVILKVDPAVLVKKTCDTNICILRVMQRIQTLREKMHTVSERDKDGAFYLFYMKPYVGVEVYLHAFLNSELHEDSASHPDHFNTGEISRCNL
jgi:hypothetical protein